MLKEKLVGGRCFYCKNVFTDKKEHPCDICLAKSDNSYSSRPLYFEEDAGVRFRIWCIDCKHGCTKVTEYPCNACMVQSPTEFPLYFEGR